MVAVLRFFYSYFFLPLSYAGLYVLRIFFHKAALRYKGEIATLNFLRSYQRDPEKILLWFHSASMGEFEQVKPVIEMVKKNHPEWVIVATFFSPSGYQYQSSFPYIDIALYLPFDFPRRVRMFLEKLQPDLAVFVRYDLWPNFCHGIRKNLIPLVLICATVDPNSLGWKFPLRALSLWMYSQCSLILTAGEDQTRLFQSLPLTVPIETGGDPRFDRIAKVVSSPQTEELFPLKSMVEAELTLILGSSWEEEENLLHEVLFQADPELLNRIRAIIVPHEPVTEHITSLRAMFPDSVCYSDVAELPDIPERAFRFFIVDAVGKLLLLYRYGDCAFVGGGFGRGVHSVAEAAGYGLPIACGPRIQQSRDAVRLHQLGALRIVKTSDELKQWLTDMLDSRKRKEVGQIAYHYFQSQIGATERIVHRLLYFIKVPMHND